MFLWFIISKIVGREIFSVPAEDFSKHFFSFRKICKKFDLESVNVKFYLQVVYVGFVFSCCFFVVVVDDFCYSRCSFSYVVGA